MSRIELQMPSLPLAPEGEIQPTRDDPFREYKGEDKHFITHNFILVLSPEISGF